MTGKYHDIIHLPHPTSSRHPRMPLIDRAAQFSPFAALSGHDDAILETARLTDGKIEPSEDQQLELDRKMQALIPLLPQHPEIVITYYVPDSVKEGGAYVTFAGNLKKIDSIDHTLYFTDGTTISPEDVLSLDSPHIKNLFDI